MKTKTTLILGIVVIFGALLVSWAMNNTSNLGSLGSAHDHAEFKVYLNNEMIDFSLAKYMVTDRFVHVENFNGVEIHKHATGVTMGYFFKTLGFKFDSECLTTDTNTKFCNQEEKTLKFYVNGVRNQNYGDYEITEGEKYLISYGSDSEEIIQEQINSV